MDHSCQLQRVGPSNGQSFLANVSTRVELVVLTLLRYYYATCLGRFSVFGILDIRRLSYVFVAAANVFRNMNMRSTLRLCHVDT